MTLKEIGSMVKVLTFINDFKKGYWDELESVFSYGYCYWFAFILKERFNGTIYYLPIENHFICLIDDKFYDITGYLEIDTNKDLVYPWEEYRLMDDLEAQRIERDCIKKERIIE